MRLVLAFGLVGTLALAACGRQELEDLNATSRIDRGEAHAGAGLFSSLAVDELGRPQVAYYHADLQALRFAEWREGAWQVATVDGGEEADRGRGARLALKGSDRYIAYQDSTEKQVRLAHRNGNGDWSLETVTDAGVDAGAFLDMVLVKGSPVIAWYDAGDGDLNLARKEGGVWNSTAVAADGDVGQYVSMAAAPDGQLYLSFYDAGRGGLLYAQVSTDGTVTLEEVDGIVAAPEEEDAEPVVDDVDTGVWSRIQAQPLKGGDPRVAAPKIVYQDRRNGRLMLAERSAEGWKRSIVDDHAFTGSDSDMLWIRGEDIVIAYLDGANLDLRIARRSGDTWVHQTLLSQGAVGFYNSLARLGDGRLALTTWHMSAGELLYLTVPERP